MGKLSKLRRLERVMRGNLDYIELADGSRYFYEPEQVWSALFLHHSDCMRADHRSEPRPDPPEILTAVAKARDRRSAVERLYAQEASPAPLTAYDLEALVERGELVPRSFLADHSYEESVEHFAKKNAEG
ncbi:MAG: hypothetical protein H0T57_09250 [Rubrobacter sp.]|jgi:hypothetical protein|nr:hypothetical protein [Rubrobacter sp.]